MGKAEKHEQRWRQGAINDVREADILLVLEANGFKLRRDGENHWQAAHQELGDHPKFAFPGGKAGGFGVNCHAQGKQGLVHPFAVQATVNALTHIRKKK